MGIAPDVATEVCLVSGQVKAIMAQIALNSILIMLLVTTARIPIACCAPVAVFDSTPFASSIVIALCSLFSQFRMVTVDVCSSAADVAQVAVNIALGKRR